MRGQYLQLKQEDDTNLYKATWSKPFEIFVFQTQISVSLHPNTRGNELEYLINYFLDMSKSFIEARHIICVPISFSNTL